MVTSLLGFMKKVMANNPLVTIIKIPQFGAGHVKQAPVNPPFYGLVFTVGLFKQGHNFGFVGVHVLQPGFAVLA
jgi:hypothetical protein